MRSRAEPTDGRAREAARGAKGSGRRARSKRPQGAHPGLQAGRAPARLPLASDAAALPFAAALFVVALATYALTSYRTVPGGDSGELILVAQTLGVAHPPGYPLFTLLGKLFSMLPLGSVAWRVNLFSATCDAAAGGLLLLATARWTGVIWAGVLAGGLFAFSPLTWTGATGAEVFPLNNLFCAGLLWLLVRFHQRPDPRIARLGALWCGLGMSNHHLFALFALPAIASVLWMGRRTLLGARSLAVLLVMFWVGLLPYLYLPFASARLPRTGWGDQTTLEGFIAHLLRRDYGTFDLAAGIEGGTSTFRERLSDFLGQLPRELFGWGLPLCLMGAWTGLGTRQGRGTQIVVAIMLALYLGVFLTRANLPLSYPLQRGIQARFWQQANLVLFFWAGGGLWTLFAHLDARARWAARFGLPVVALAGVVLPLGFHYRAQDRSATTSVHDFARAVLETLPPNTLLICSGDYLTHSIRYLQDNDHVRSDVRVVDHILLQQPWEVRRVAKYQPDVVLPGTQLTPGTGTGGFNLARLMDSNAARFPIFIANGIRIPDDSYLQSYNSYPLGLVQWMVPKATQIDLDEWLRRDAEALSRFTPPAAGRYPDDSWEHETLRQYWYSRYTLGVQLINYAAGHANDRRASELAVRTLDSVLTAGVFVQPELFKNLGGAYWVLSTHDPRAREAMKGYFARYLALVPDAPDRGDIQSMMGQ